MKAAEEKITHQYDGKQGKLHQTVQRKMWQMIAQYHLEY